MATDPTNPENGQPDWEALARYLAGESSPAESERLRRWLAERPEDEALLAALERAVGSVPELAPADLDVEAALARVKARGDFEPAAARHPVTSIALRRRRARQLAPEVHLWKGPMLAAAATLILLAGASMLWRRHAGSGERPGAAAGQTVATSVGQRDSLLLADGSRIVVGPGSAVTIGADYGATGREITLRGEAYFDVRHDARRPFTVRTPGATIVDVGTRFAVHSDTGLGVRISVAAGAVRLRPAASADSGIVLLAGDRGLLVPGSAPVAQRQQGNADDLAWIQGRLVFDDAPMTDVASDLRRWYGIQLVLADSALAHRHVTTAAFDAREPVDRVLHVLALTLGATMERRGAGGVGDTVVVRARTGSTPPR